MLYFCSSYHTTPAVVRRYLLVYEELASLPDGSILGCINSGHHRFNPAALADAFAAAAAAALLHISYFLRLGWISRDLLSKPCLGGRHIGYFFHTSMFKEHTQRHSGHIIFSWPEFFGLLLLLLRLLPGLLGPWVRVLLSWLKIRSECG